jgi:hypothetical protein
MGMSDVIPSATLERYNNRSFTQFARVWQQLHHFRHRIADDDPRRPTSAGLKIDEVAKLSSLLVTAIRLLRASLIERQTRRGN